MTQLWLVVIAVAAVAGLASGARRGGPGRRAARAHHRVLDTLDTITRHSGEHPVRSREAEDAHTHVRLVRTDPARDSAGAPRSAPRPGRSLGAAPFRTPVARHTVDEDAEPLPLGEEQVRLLRASPPSPTPPAASGEAPVEHRGGSERVDTHPGADAPGAGFDPVLRFDEEAAPAEEPAAPAPDVPHLTPETVAALATSGRRRLQAGEMSRTARRPHRRRSHRRRPAARSRRTHRRVRGATILVAAAVVVGVGAVGAVLATATGGSPSPAAQVRHTNQTAPPPAPTSSTTANTTPSTAAAPATLVSSTPQDAVYSLAGPATITFTTSSGVSWIQLRHGDQTGAVVYQGSLQPGQAQTITGPAWVRLGNPTAVTISVNNTPLAAPALTAGEPYNLQFR